LLLWMLIVIQYIRFTRELLTSIITNNNNNPSRVDNNNINDLS